MKSLRFPLLSLGVILLLTLSQATAQTTETINTRERNAKVTIAIGQLSYEVPEQRNDAVSLLTRLADIILAGENTHERTNYGDAVRAAVVQGVANAHRTIAIEGGLTEAEAARPNTFYMDGTVANISTTTKVIENVTYVKDDGKGKGDDRDKPHNTPRGGSGTNNNNNNDNHKDDKKGDDNMKRIVTPQTVYKALINVTIHVKDAATDAIVDSHTFDISELDGSWLSTSDDALSSALGILSGQVTKYFNTWLPLTANVIQGAREQGTRERELYIDLGSSEGAAKGIHFNIYYAGEVAGREIHKQIGKARIEEVEGDEISICKVSGGAKDIKAALDEGIALVAQSID